MIQKITIALFSMVLIYSCVTNAITGRSQLNLVSEGDLQSMALVQYKDFLIKNKVVPANNRDAEMVKRVGERVSSAVKQYYKKKGLPNELDPPHPGPDCRSHLNR